MWLTINQQRTIILILSVFQTKRKDHLYSDASAGCYIPFPLILSGGQWTGWLVSVCNVISVKHYQCDEHHSPGHHPAPTQGCGTLTDFTQVPSFAPKTPGLVSVFTREVSECSYYESCND